MFYTLRKFKRLLIVIAAICNKDSAVYQVLHTMGLVTPPHRKAAIYFLVWKVLVVLEVNKLIYVCD